MMRVADYVVNFFVSKNINDIFLVSGGGFMYLLDALSLNKKITYISNHHEQASSTAAEAWARINNQPGVCFVTTGPGGTNAITGVAGAWVDSIPMIIVSGQVKQELIADYSKTRQIGPQELNIVDMVTPITKYAVTITDPKKIRYELEKCYYEATVGRPGPTWINIPLDIQSALINEKHLKGFSPPKVKNNQSYLTKKVKELIELLKTSKRPLIVAGHGIRLSKSLPQFEQLIDQLHIPVVLPINGLDLLAENNKHLIGKFGPAGTRRGNFALQNADLIISIGASLNIASTGFDYHHFGFKAKKVMVNIDQEEINNKKIKIDLAIIADVKEFINELLTQLNKNSSQLPTINKWISACQNWKKNYPLINKDYYENKKYVNSYVFFDVLSDYLPSQNFLVTGIALDAAGMYQVFRVKKGQRAFVNKNLGQMGWDLPASIGVCVANNKKTTICVAGDGSIQLNIQELQTISYYQLPIKLFIFNNDGYESIRATQDNFFQGRLVGADKSSGVSNPNFKLLAKAHGLAYERIINNRQLKNKISKVLKLKGPVLCEINIDPKQKRMPKAASFRHPNGRIESRPLEDMWPFLPREEIDKNMKMFDQE